MHQLLLSHRKSTLPLYQSFSPFDPAGEPKHEFLQRERLLNQLIWPSLIKIFHYDTVKICFGCGVYISIVPILALQ